MKPSKRKMEVKEGAADALGLNTSTRRILDEILRRMQNDEPVTEDLLSTLPLTSRVEIPIVVNSENGSEACTLLITNGPDGPKVTVQTSVH